MTSRTSTRRQLLTESMSLGSALILGAAAPLPASTTSSTENTIHDEIEFRAKPEQLYEILLDENLFKAFTGEAAEIDRAAGGAFAIFAGRVKGRTVEMKPSERIVQAWRVETWPQGVYAIVRFEFAASSVGSRISFDVAGFPPSERQAQLTGWPKFYWTPLKKYLDHD